MNKTTSSGHTDSKFRHWIAGHKKTSIIILIVVFGLIYWKSGINNSSETKYILSTVSKGTIISSVTGSGQVSGLNQVEIKPKVSGDVTYIAVKSGDQVKAGGLILIIDTRDAEKAVRDAETNLESSQISLEKLKQPADNLSIIQAENSLAKSKESKQNSESDLSKYYEDGFNDISNVFLNLPSIMSGLQDMLLSSSKDLSSSGQWNIDYYAGVIDEYDHARAVSYREDAYGKYQLARVSFDKTFNDYKLANRSISSSQAEALLEETYNTTRQVSEAVKSANNLLQLYRDTIILRNLTPASLSNTHLSTLNSYTSTINGYISNLLIAQSDIKQGKDSLVNADRSIVENTEALAKLKAGADELDIRSSELSVTQKQNALLDAKEKLADYYVRAPFDGTITKLNVKKTDSVSSGTAITTIVTSQKIAEISLNEVDTTKLKVGQKAVLTFDAIDTLNITGQVSEIDTVGTISQGVVSYSVDIIFDTQDERVKSGMTVNTSIQTEVRQDVLVVPISAIKTQNGLSRVQIFMPELANTGGAQGVVSKIEPEQIEVTTGISDDSNIEILSGLTGGEQIVVRTVSEIVNAMATTNSAGARGLGGGIRF